MESFNIKFVGEVEKYPVLYDYTLQGHFRRAVTETAWTNIAKEVKLPVIECKLKWRNLRTSLGRNLKPKPSGSGAQKKKPYYLIDAMQFAVPFMKVVGNPTGNLEMSRIYSPVPTKDVDEPDRPEVEFLEETSSQPEVCLAQTSQEDRVATPPSETTIMARGPHGQPILKRRATKSDAADNAFAAFCPAEQAKLSNPLLPKNEEKKEEGIKNFLLSLIQDLMKLNDVQLRNYKSRALCLIDEVIGENSSNNNS